MKIPASRVAQVVKGADFRRYRCVIFYGPDEGMVAHQASLLIGNMMGGHNDALSLVKLEAEKLTQSPHLLSEEVATVSMFAEEKIVFCPHFDEKKVGILEDVMSLSRLAGFLVITAGNLSPRSKLRLLGEKHDDIAIIGCYADTPESLRSYMEPYLKEQGYTIERDALYALSERLGNDRMVSMRELEKLMMYVLPAHHITLDHVENATNYHVESTVEKLILKVFSGKEREASYLYEKIKNDVHPINIIRVAVYHAKRLQSLKSLIEETGSFEQATKKLRPPLFFRDKDTFAIQVRVWSDHALSHVLSECFKREIDLKQSGTLFQCDMFLLKLVRFARKRLS